MPILFTSCGFFEVKVSSLMRLHYVGGSGRMPPASGFITVTHHPSSEGVKERGHEFLALAH